MDDESQAPQSGMSRGKAAAWVVMLAVGAAMVLVMLAPESAPDPTAVQPPLADASGPVAAIEPLADDPEAVLEAGMLAPLDYTLKDMDGFDVSLACLRAR